MCSSPDAELVLFLADSEPGEPALDDKRGDAAVAGGRIDRREDDEHVGFVGVGDPELPSRQDEVAVLVGLVAQAGAGLRAANASLPEPASESA
jgi:hypothetical protein